MALHMIVNCGRVSTARMTINIMMLSTIFLLEKRYSFS